MPFFTRPNFEDRQVVQYSASSITLSGDTNINPTGNFRIYKDAFPGLVATSLDANGTVGWGPISGISWSISACTSPLYVNNLVSCPLSAGTIQVDAGALTLNSELQFLISLSAGTNTDDILVIDSSGYVKSIPYVNGGSMWYVPYGYTLVVPDNYQSFVYGDLYVLGTIDLQTNAQLVVLNGNIILSGGTIIGSGTTQLVTLGDNYVTGGTFNNSNGTLTLNRQNGSVSITGITFTSTPFTGGTGSCITDLYVSNIHSCSPLNINPLDEGNVYFGSTSGLTFDVTNKRLGLNQPNPEWTFDFHSYDKRSKLFYYDNIGPISPAFADVQEVVLSGTSDLNVIVGTVTDGNVSTVIGTRGSTNVGVFGDNVGKVGDGYLATSAYANGLNIMNFPSALSNREDYIRFYAGNYATAVSDIHIQGSGTTRGYIGMGEEDPLTKLHVSGNTVLGSQVVFISDVRPTQAQIDTFLNNGNKGLRLQYSHTGDTVISSINVNNSGRTGVVLGRATGGTGSAKNFTITNNGDDYIRTATTPVNGFDFYKNKVVFQVGTNLNGTVFNLDPSGNDGRLWFEQNANSPMVIMGGGSPDDLRLGIALNPDGTEMPTANLQIGGTGTTGTVQVNQDVLNVNAYNTYGKIRPNYYTIIDSGTTASSPGVYQITINAGWVIEQIQIYTKVPDSVLTVGSLVNVSTLSGNIWFPSVSRPFGVNSNYIVNMLGIYGGSYIEPAYFPSGDTLLINFIDPLGVATNVTDGTYGILITHWNGSEIL